MATALPEGAQRVQRFLDQNEARWSVFILGESTATARDAAQALGVFVSQIGKSIVFSVDDHFIVAVLCGDDRVAPGRLAGVVNGREARALKAEEVRQATGFVIGGVSPFALPAGLAVVIDSRLAEFPTCYVAAGHPRAVVQVTPCRMAELVDARIGNIRQ